MLLDEQITKPILEKYKSIEDEKQKENFRQEVRNTTKNYVETSIAIVRLLNKLSGDNAIDLDELTIIKYKMLGNKLDIIGVELIKELSDDLGEKINTDETNIEKLLRSDLTYKDDEFNKQLSKNLTNAINLLVGEINKMIVDINKLIEKY